MHGKNIELLQHIISRLIEGQSATRLHVHLEVNDYMKIKEAKLYSYIDSQIALIQ
jgi:predicted RNA-binding protein Jag